MEFVRGANEREVGLRAADFISRELLTYADKPTLLLLSGGSSLSFLEYMSDTALRMNMTVGQVDERWTKDTAVLNATAFRATEFSKKLAERGVPFVPINVNASTVEESAHAYEQYLKQWKSAFRDAVIITVLGIGEDGHTAGIMPNPSDKQTFLRDFYDTRSWYVGYNTIGKGKYPERVTVSFRFLYQEVKSAFVIAAGQHKKNALEKIYNPDGSLADTPARILHEMRKVYLFSDVTP